MITQLTTDLSDLEDLKGIRIDLDRNRRPVLIFTYKDAPAKTPKKVSWAFWSAVAVVYAAAGALMLWLLR